MRRLLLVAALTIAAILGSTTSAWAYLHEYNAKVYAQSHVWRTFCPNTGGCSAVYTYWTTRRSNNRVDVSVRAKTRTRGTCDRTFYVSGNDGAEYISGAATWYYVCY